MANLGGRRCQPDRYTRRVSTGRAAVRCRPMRRSRLAATIAALLVPGTVLVLTAGPLSPRGQGPAAAPAEAPAAASIAAPGAESPWGPWLEPDAPFFSSVVDARAAGDGLPADNLAPRSLVLRAGQGWWAAFDPDLLRVVAVWQGDAVTPTALAPGSYHVPDRKTPGGQNALPMPDGRVVLATGIHPGWQTGDRPLFTDPRVPAPSTEEVGRGPIDASAGR